MAVVVHVWEGLWGHAALDILIPRVTGANELIANIVTNPFSTPEQYEELATQEFIERHYISFHPTASDKELQAGELTKGVAFDGQTFTFAIDHKRWSDKNEEAEGNLLERARKLGQPRYVMNNSRYLLLNLDESAMRDYWLEMSGAEDTRYHLLFQNCSTVAATLLAIGWYAQNNAVDHGRAKEALAELSQQASIRGWKQFIKDFWQQTVVGATGMKPTAVTGTATAIELQARWLENPPSFAATLLKGAGNTLNRLFGAAGKMSMDENATYKYKAIAAGMLGAAAFVKLMNEVAWNPEKVKALAEYLQKEVG